MIQRSFSFVFCLVVWASIPAVADEPEFGLAVEKLEHLFESDASVFEIEATLGSEHSFIGAKSEFEFDSGTDAASDNQLYYSRSINSRLSGIVGLRHLDLKEGGDTSAMLGVTAELPLNIEVLALTYFAGEYTEGQVEFERPTPLSTRMELLPKIEVRAYSHDAESIAAELRLAHLTTDRLKTYVGVSWSRVVGTSSDENGLTALAGLSYEW